MEEPEFLHVRFLVVFFFRFPQKVLSSVRKGYPRVGWLGRGTRRRSFLSLGRHCFRFFACFFFNVGTLLRIVVSFATSCPVSKRVLVIV